MTKRDIVEALATTKPHISKSDIGDLVQQSLDLITEAMENGEKVELRRFGVFELQVREERLGRNPATPESEVVIPRRTVVKFKPGSEMKARVAGRWGEQGSDAHS